MLRPGRRVLRRIRGTFADFLRREQGYGSLDEALYGLMWNNPTFVIGMVFTGRGGFILRREFEVIWLSLIHI